MSRRSFLSSLVAAAIVVSAGSAFAAWTKTATGASVAKGATLSAPVIGTSTASGSSVTVNWTPSVAPSGQLDGFYVTRNNGTSNAKACGTDPATATYKTATTTTCSDTGLAAGTYTYTVTAVFKSWSATSGSSNSVSIVAGTPTVAFTFPVDGSSYNATTYQAGCVAGTDDFCGTATAGSGTLSTVKYSVKRLSDLKYWDPAANSGAGGFTSSSEILIAASGTGSWSASFASSRFTNGVQYAIRAVATNSNSLASSTTSTFTYDTASPTVSTVTSSAADGTYKAGAVLPIQVNFSEPVVVTGGPQLTLATAGSTNEVVAYSTGTGTSTLTFNYTVQPGDTSTDLNYVGTSSLALNGGSVKDTAGNSAALTLPATSSGSSLAGSKALVVDTTGPSAASFLNSNKTGGTAGLAELGDTVTLTYSEAIAPGSISPGWDGTSALNVVVRATTSSSNDKLTFYNSSNTSQLPLGTDDLGGAGYISASTVTFGATGTPSTLTLSGGVVTITLGTQNTAPPGATTQSNKNFASWTPSTTVTDLVGNPCDGVKITGGNAKQF